MKKNSASKNPALKSMTTLALYLLLLIGMWAILGYVLFPDSDKEVTPAQVVTANEALMKQAAENVVDSEKWPGVMETAEMKKLMEMLGVTATAAEDGEACFYLP